MAYNSPAVMIAADVQARSILSVARPTKVATAIPLAMSARANNCLQ